MQEIDFYLVDAFSGRAFGGNAAAVCPLEAWLPDETLLKMAKQHNQSETAFFVRTDNGFELRWFTTQDEINLCGHATLAASHVIFEYLDYPHTEITFTTRFVGELTVQRSGDWLTLNFPAWSTEVVDTPPPVLFSSLGINAAKEVRAGRDYMVVLDSQRQVEALTPDITAMLPLGKMVCVTAPGDEYDFVSRFFCPGRGTGGSGDGVSAQHADPVLERKAWKNADVGPPGLLARRGSALRAERRPRADWRAGHAVYEGENFPSSPGLRSSLKTMTPVYRAGGMLNENDKEPAMYSITAESAHHPDILALITALDRYQSVLYPAESNHLLDLTELPDDSLILMIIRDTQLNAVGCGAVVLNGDGTGEMKRVYIDPTHRGQRLGDKLLAALEDEALSRCCHTVRLETGIKQHAAIRLYQQCGYERRPAFAPYNEDPLSLFMEKTLVADVRLAAL